MRLCDTISHHDEGLPQFAEPEFLYLNRSTRQDVSHIRELLEVWFSRPCRVSGDHPSLTLFAKILLPWVSPPWHVGWETALLRRKISHVHLVPLNVGSRKRE
jgi:hypothetical protein